MYTLARQPDEVVNKVMKRQQYKIPGTDRTKRWEQMNDFEWIRSIGDIKGKPAFDADKEVRGVASGLRRLIRDAKKCQGHKKDVDTDNTVAVEKPAGELILEMRKLR